MSDEVLPIQQEIAEMSHVGLGDDEIAKNLDLDPPELEALWNKLTDSLKGISREAAVDLILARLILQARADLATKSDELALVVRTAEQKAIITFNIMGMITGVSRDSEGLLGVTSEELIGKPIDAILTGRNSVEQSTDEMSRAEDGEDVLEIRSHSRTDGTVFDAEHTIVAIVGNVGHVTGFIREIRDLTARRIYEIEIEELKSTLAVLLPK